MRSILQNSAIAVVAATVTSAASLSIAVGSMPALVAQTKYSREFEAAADEYAFRLLKKHHYSLLFVTFQMCYNFAIKPKNTVSFNYC
jgi:Zn-dependent protease with chaperone function